MDDWMIQFISMLEEVGYCTSRRCGSWRWQIE